MASDRQLFANRANALSSTGPRSLAGKRRSSRNAMKHGLTADHTLLPGENAEEFRGLKGAMFSSLRPEGALENQLVERAASLIWRMRRIQIFEGALFAWTAEYQKRAYDDDLEVQAAEELPPNDPGIDAQEELADELKLGRAFEALLSADLTGKLSRYERGMQRSLELTLRTLRDMQSTRVPHTPTRRFQYDDDDPEVDRPGVIGPP